MSSETQDKVVVSRAQLSPAKRALLEKRLAGRASGEAVAQSIRPAPRNGPPPVSFAQQRLWFLDQLEPGLFAYNMPAAVRLIGNLDVGVLNSSLNEIVRRHESLRTTFKSVVGQPVQVIAPSLDLSISVVDLTELSDEVREAEAMRLSQREAQRQFDLIAGPLIRALLIRVRTDEHVLVLTMHHIVSDGWSQGVLKTELGALYEAGISGRPTSLPELSIQYADFAQWQRGWLQGEERGELHRQLAYWREHLTGAPPSLDLPVDRVRPPQMNYQGSTFLFELSVELSESLAALSRSEGVTLFMTLLAAFKTLLWRYTGQDDVVVGTPVANRNREELEPLIGFFVNTLALRTQFSGDSTFRELLARVRDVALGAYAHQDLPFELLVEELQPVRDLSRNPLFQIVFDLQSAPAAALELTGLTLKPYEFAAETTRFDLELHLTSTSEGILGALVYSTNLFDESTVRQLAERYRMLLEAVVAKPEQRLSRIELLTSAERDQLLFAWNDTVRPYPTTNVIPDLFEIWASRTPEKIALVFGDEQVTYEQLNRRANQLAH
ncbi:MAG TPA: condensation domain-containing protein, partial [Pyrinomonadaceae bacterium]|nr:condensation domain-containing protein [Pyrinomonadaceae bacterium]